MEGIMVGYKKPVKKTKKEKDEIKFKKRRKLEKKWRTNALEKKTQTKNKQEKIKTTKKRKKIKGKAWYKKKCDILFSKFIRKRDGRCVKCGKTEGLQCSHVVPRGNLLLRWDGKNAKALCFGCHICGWHRDPIEYLDWFKKLYPDRLLYLEKRRHLIKQMSLGDYIELYQELKNKQ